MRERCLFTDRDHLTGRHYANEDLFAIRVATHQRYTIPPVDFIRWVLDLIPWQGHEQVLDVGCGNGQYIEPLAGRLAGGGRYLAGDLSWGMLHDLTKNSPAVNLDAAALPVPERSCDVIMANHMLYHVPDIDRAVAECYRALRRGGRLLATTNSRATMAELRTLIYEGCDRLGAPQAITWHHDALRFSLENGQALLARRFDQVERHVLHTALVFPEPAPLLAYINSMRDMYEPELPEGIAWDDLLTVWQEMVANHVARHGTFRIGKVVCAFVAVKRPL
jgi:SAM-dependent methyltransferase